MPDRGERERDANEGVHAGGREGLLSAAAARALEAEYERWILWLPVLFAAGILFYFALADEPGTRLAIALLLGALGLSLAARHARLGLCIGGVALAFASGFAVAKLRTEIRHGANEPA